MMLYMEQDLQHAQQHPHLTPVECGTYALQEWNKIEQARKAQSKNPSHDSKPLVKDSTQNKRSANVPEDYADTFTNDDGSTLSLYPTDSSSQDHQEAHVDTTQIGIDGANVPTILVIHASVGSGHRSAAIAVAQSLEHIRDTQEAAFPDGSPLDPKTRIAVIDILAWGSHVFDGDHTASMFTGATRPFYDLTWRYCFTGRLLWSGGTFLNYTLWRKFTRFIASVKPIAVVATHIMGANMAAGARTIANLNFPIVSVPTDYETEGLWPHRATDCFCVATESMAETLRARKIPEENIAITGIPTRIDFQKEYDSQTVRQSLGLPEDKKLVLVLAGAYLSQPYVHFRSVLDKALPIMHNHENLHMVIVCGKDSEYADHVQSICDEEGLTNVTIYGYVSKMAQLMAASDLIVCKSGGLTVTECLCAHAPMILVGRAYGQEKANVNMLINNGAALHVTTVRELMDALHQVALHPEKISTMLFNANLIRRPMAAHDIAHIALDLSTLPRNEAHGSRPSHHWIFSFYWGNRPAHLR
jgi:processive 1,2-diacylglycerol beta-glucosyltransferase